jgi:hypothetical protein
MGSQVGAIGNVLAGDQSGLKPVGVTFPITEGNMSRWRIWWRYAVLDQTALWGAGCFLGMYLNVNLAASIVPSADVVNEQLMGVYQARRMAEMMWQGFWVLSLINGFWILFSTHLGNTDILIRTVSDICWPAFPGVRRRPIGTLYAILLLVLTIWAVIAVHLGSAIQLFTVLGLVATPIMSIAAIQIWRVNMRFLPKEIRPALWRQIGLLLCALAYGSITIAVAYKTYQSLTTAKPAAVFPDKDSSPSRISESQV